MEINGELKNLCDDLLNLYRKNLEDNEHNASHNLEKNATYKIVSGDFWFELYFNLEDYWKYLEYGTKPHFPPMSVIEQWIKVKRIIPDNRAKRVPTTKQLAYLICRKIAKVGTKETNILKNTIESDTGEKLVEYVSNIILEKINEMINYEIS